MGNVFKLKARHNPAFTRAGRKSKRAILESFGQLNMFERVTALRKLPTNQGYFEKALKMDQEGNQAATTMYKKAIEHRDSAVNAWCNLGILAAEKCETGPAFDAFTRALELDPRHFESHLNLGNLYFQEEEWRLAGLHYELSRMIRPHCSELYYNLGLTDYRLGDQQRARKQLSRFLETTGSLEQTRLDEVAGLHAEQGNRLIQIRELVLSARQLVDKLGGPLPDEEDWEKEE